MRDALVPVGRRLLLAACACLSGAALARAQDAAPEPVERVVVDLGAPAPNHPYVKRSPNGEGVAYRVGDSRVVHNANVGKAYENAGLLALSPDGRHVAYRVEQKGPPFRAFVVRDGTEGRRYEHTTQPAFSPDSRHLTYSAVRNRRWLIVTDGEEREVDDDYVMGVTFTSDGRHLVYGVKRGREYFRMLDAARREPGATARSVTGFRKRRRIDDRGNTAWVVDTVLPAPDTPLPCRLVERRVKSLGTVPPWDRPHRRYRSPTHALLVLAVKFTGETAVYVNGREVGTYRQVRRPVTFSPDGRHAAWTAKRENAWHVYRDGVAEGPAWDRCGTLVFSPDGAHLAWVAVIGDESMLVVDGNARTKHRNLAEDEAAVSVPVYSPDSRRLAYTVRTGERTTLIENGRSASYEHIHWPVFSPDSRHLAYVACEGRRYFVVCDGRAGRRYDHVAAPRFSADSRHLYHVARRGDRSLVVLDGVAGPLHERVRLLDAVVAHTGRLRYTVIDGGRERLVEVAWPTDRNRVSGTTPVAR